MSSKQFSFGPPSNIDEEILKYEDLSPREVQAKSPDSNDDSGREAFKKYSPINYATNYVSLLTPPISEAEQERIRIENGTWLKKYYLSKKLTSHATLRHGSVTSTSETSVVTSERSKSAAFLDRFLDYQGDVVDVFKLRENQEPLKSDARDGNKERFGTFGSFAASPYYDHYQRLRTVDIRDRSVLKKHTLWMPVVTKDFSEFQRQTLTNSDELCDRFCPLFIDGSGYIPKEYDTYDGCTVISSVFSEHKLPAFAYHCAIDINDSVFIMGGLVACHRYDEEGPNLQDFEVDGVENLPPPLLPKIINNPSMINNARLYVMSVSSSHVMRPELSGSVPPPLLCMRASKLTERHIFFYGGFEIKTEAVCDDHGICHLKKRAFVNSTGYILDTISYRFSKIEIAAQPYKFVSYPTLAARFGHMQMSVSTNKSVSNYGYNQKNYSSNEFGEADGSTSGDTSTLNSPAISLYSASKNCNNGHGSAVYTIIIFGGYRQTGDDNYEAMNDLWKIEVPVVSKGKRGYYKFADTATASIIPKNNPNDPWPSARAFFGYARASSGLLAKTSSYDGMLKRLYENFSVNLTSTASPSKSKPIFPNIPHARKEPSSPRQYPTKETRSNSSSSAKCRVGSPLQSSTPLQGRKQNGEADLFVIHGGSENTKVLGDMWWFDMETESWAEVTTYGKDQERGMTPIQVCMVGQSMVNVGEINVSLGGLNQEEVDILFLGKEDPHEKTDHRLKIGHDFLTIFDLNTQCLQGHEIRTIVDGDKTRQVLADNTPNTSRLITSFGCQVLHTNGTLTLVGGLIAKKLDLNVIALRGAVLESVLPSISLAS